MEKRVKGFFSKRTEIRNFERILLKLTVKNLKEKLYRDAFSIMPNINAALLKKRVP